VGEAKFGLLKGVISSVSGWIGKTEVVKLEFDPSVISYQALVEEAKAGDCATLAFPLDAKQSALARTVYGDRVLPVDADFRGVADTKYYLRRTLLKHVPMTRAQATRVNSKVERARRSGVLSSSQLELLAFIEKHPKAGWDDVVDQDFSRSWQKVMAKRIEIERAKIK